MSDESVEGGELVWACTVFATVEDFDDCECDCEIDLDDAVQLAVFENFLIAASDELCLLSGNELRGECSQTVTICRDRCSCRRHCNCDRDTIMLPGPIISVTSIEFEGYTFVADDFKIVDDYGIAWANGADPGRWPARKDIEIEYTWGHPIDQITKNAALQLACMAMRACITDQRGVVNADNIQRQGTGFSRQRTSTISDVAQKAALEAPWMAKFLALHNPRRAVMPPSVWAPEFDDVHVLRSLT